MHADLSPDFVDTWAFLDRRVEDVMEAGKTFAELRQAVSTVLAGKLRGVT